jgi:hypothetical protein
MANVFMTAKIFTVNDCVRGDGNRLRRPDAGLRKDGHELGKSSVAIKNARDFKDERA